MTVTGTFKYNNLDIEGLYSTLFPKVTSSNFFLSPVWICQWLEQLKEKPELITFYDDTALCGFVLVGYQRSLAGSKAFINQIGNRLFDQVWIEYNDVICQSNQQECREALLRYLNDKNIYQIHISNTYENTWQSPFWKEWSSQSIKAYETKLDDKSVSDNFSKNTKRQISRSKSFIEQEFGPISMQWVEQQNQRDNLEEIGKLHIEQWDSHSYGSGFSNPHFVDFHTNIIEKGLGSFVHIAKFLADNQTLGFLYFFSYSNRIYFYLSAINYLTENNKFKPGLVMHEQAMDYFKAQNYEYYDFLAGEARYKSSLCSQEYELYNKILYSNKLRYAPLKWLVDVKRKFLKQRPDR